MVAFILAFSISLSNQEQLLVELINRARANPSAEAARHGVRLNKGMMPGTISSAAKQPLAPHQALASAADRHSQRMLSKDYFSHKDPSGSMPSDRARAAGYPGLVGENIAMGSNGSLGQTTQVYERHKQLFLSPGHRKIMLDPKYREIGTGIRKGAFKKSRNACVVTEMFGNRGGVFITGVVYADVVVKNNFYSIGEGIGDVSIAAVDAAGGAYTVTTGPSGGYSLQVPPGNYTVVASGSWLDPVAVDNVSVSSRNVKVDFETSKLGSLSKPALARSRGAIPLATPPTSTVSRAVPLAHRPSSTNRAVPLASRSAPLASGTVPLAGRDVPLAGRDVPLAGRDVPLARQAVPLASRAVPASIQGLAPTVQIVDDGDIGHTISGSWSGGSPMGCGGDSLIAKRGHGQRVSWTFAVTPGRYRVSATWPRHPGGATAAPFTIRSCCRRLGVVKVNQRCAADDFHDIGSDWHDLGSYCVTGTTLVVDLSSSKTGHVIADAIRIERIGDACHHTHPKKKSSVRRRMGKFIPGN